MLSIGFYYVFIGVKASTYFAIYHVSILKNKLARNVFSCQFICESLEIHATLKIVNKAYFRLEMVS